MKKFFIILSISTLALASCNKEKTTETRQEEEVIPQDTPAEEENGDELVETITLEGEKLSLVSIDDSPTYPETKLSIESPVDGSTVAAGEVSFKFKVEGGSYELGAATADQGTKDCAASGKGQHIHLIVNNAPYAASYTEEKAIELEGGNKVALAFISRSYHESLKHEGAAALVQFQVGEEAGDPIDLEGEHLFYSRPKSGASYSLAAGSKVLLDFYLVNTALSAEGNYVEATIDGETFKVTEWRAYAIQGLEVGDHTCSLKLINKDGAAIEGPFNTAEEITFIVTE